MNDSFANYYSKPHLRFFKRLVRTKNKQWVFSVLKRSNFYTRFPEPSISFNSTFLSINIKQAQKTSFIIPVLIISQYDCIYFNPKLHQNNNLPGSVKIENKNMEHKAKNIRPFIGAKDYETSRRFYKDLGFEESVISAGMSLFKTNNLGFYLQNAYIKDWIDNTMIFLEVDNVERYWNELIALNLQAKYPGVKLTSTREYNWGRECFLHDPSGILWHFGEFK